jgi:hypothetical protein
MAREFDWEIGEQPVRTIFNGDFVNPEAAFTSLSEKLKSFPNARRDLIMTLLDHDISPVFIQSLIVKPGWGIRLPVFGVRWDFVYQPGVTFEVFWDTFMREQTLRFRHKKQERIASMIATYDLRLAGFGITEVQAAIDRALIVPKYAEAATQVASNLSGEVITLLINGGVPENREFADRSGYVQDPTDSNFFQKTFTPKEL